MGIQKEFRFLLPPDLLTRIGLRAIAFIRVRTQRGLDDSGAPFAPYGTTPFARPLGGITSRTRQALGNKLSLFKTKKGKLWALIDGGYKAYKEAARPQDSGIVNLTDTGTMMRALTIVKVDPATNTISIGFTRVEDALKAFYHNVEGVGKSRAIRHFMGLTPDERAELATMASEGITIEV